MDMEGQSLIQIVTIVCCCVTAGSIDSGYLDRSWPILSNFSDMCAMAQQVMHEIL